MFEPMKCLVIRVQKPFSNIHEGALTKQHKMQRCLAIKWNFSRSESILAKQILLHREYSSFTKFSQRSRNNSCITISQIKN